MRVLIGGSHGLIGSALYQRLADLGHEVVRLVRQETTTREVLWDPYKGPIDPNDLERFDAVVHLGGIGIGEKRWTEKYKAQMWDSRVVTTEVLAKALTRLAFPPKVFVCASAVGFYGSQGDEELDETRPQGEGFMAQLCGEWEKSSAFAADAVERVVNLRSGVVFAKDQGTLSRQVPLFKLGLGGRLGSGQQWLSWIDIEDEVDAIVHTLTADDVTGPVNLVSPNPVTNEDFTKLLATVLHRPAIVPAPRWMISLALGGEIADELLLASQRCVPEKLLDSGFAFKHPNPAESLVRFYSPSELDLFEEDPESGTLQVKQADGATDVRIDDANGDEEPKRNGRRP